MTPQFSAQAFELFAQAERTMDRSQGGLGIGLALVKRLMELHEGSIAATSEGIAQGSRFTLCLPRHSATAPAGDSDAPSQLETAGPRKLTVLIVDDNRDAASMLAMLIEVLGYRVLVEHGSLSALRTAQAHRPDVCLLDIGLPDMDGAELARRLKAEPETAASILVAITGYSQDQERVVALGAGFDHYFVKPVDAARLTTLLADIARGGARP